MPDEDERSKMMSVRYVHKSYEELEVEIAALKRGIEHIRKQTTEMAIVQMCDILLAAEEQEDE